MSKKLFLFAFGVLLSVALMWHVSPQEIMPVYASASCNVLSGVSGYASDPDSGVVDFDYGVYAAGASQTTGLVISDDYKACVSADTGAVTGYAWNPNAGWLQMDWCLDGVCSGLGQAEMDLGTGYWSGYAWSDSVGWVWFDWTCPIADASCSTTQRVYTDLVVGYVTGYAWNDRLGWIDFGHGTVTKELPPISVIPSVTISPDPLQVTKYGLGPSPLEKGVFPAAPMASGEDDQEYVITVQLYNSRTGELLDNSESSGYDVEIGITPTEGSFLCYDQIDQTCRENEDTTDDTEAIYYPDGGVATYDADEHGWQRALRSYAPTSDMNGYDKNGDGVIDFYFDIDLEAEALDPDNLVHSNSTNKFALDSILLTVTPKGSAPEVILSDNDPLFGLNEGSDEEYTLKFAPAIEVTNLERVDDDGYFTAYIDAIANTEVQHFQGIVARWTSFPAVTSFDVNAILNVNSTTSYDGGATWTDVYSFLFDRDGDGDYQSTFVDSSSKDSNTMMNRYTISGPAEGMCDYLDDFNTRRFVPVECDDGAAVLGAGAAVDGATSGALIENAEIVSTLGAGVAGGELSSPRYMTQVIYDLGPALPTVKYRSNYLPQPSSDIGSQQNITVSGSVTSTTGQTTVTSSDDIVVIGNIATIAVRNELFRRFSEYTKGVTPLWSGDVAQITGDFVDAAGKAVKLLEEGNLLYYRDVGVVQIENDGETEKTIVVYGGNIVIDVNLTDVGFVAFKDNQGNGGNILVSNKVTDLDGVYAFAEGSVFSYAPGSMYDVADEGYTIWGDSDIRIHELRNQLFWKGSVVSQNTIFGGPLGVLPSGVTTTDLDKAMEYDLNELREFTQCWRELDLSGAPVDRDRDGSVWLDDEADGIPDPDDVEDCPDSDRSANISDPDSDYYNTPVYFEYTPPPSSLPLLGESQAGSLNVFN